MKVFIAICTLLVSSTALAGNVGGTATAPNGARAAPGAILSTPAAVNAMPGSTVTTPAGTADRNSSQHPTPSPGRAAASPANPSVRSNSADDPALQATPSFKELDRDSDDEISEEEAQKNPAFAKEIMKADVDHSRAVNATEFRRAERAKNR